MLSSISNGDTAQIWRWWKKTGKDTADYSNALKGQIEREITMMIYLPWIDPIDTENLPEDFEAQVKTSFGKFTKETNRDYTHEDKLTYLDNLRRYYLRGKHQRYTEDCVNDLMKKTFEYSLDEYGEILDKEELLSIEFMGSCLEHGFFPFRDQYDRDSSSRNNTALKVILEIIRIVVYWEHEEAAKK